MANLGNTGKRYKFRHIAKADVSERGGVQFTLDCGHKMTVYEPSEPLNSWDYIWTKQAADSRIGERQACYECAVAKVT